VLHFILESTFIIYFQKMKKKKALICGVSGQDGAFLARLLFSKNYELYGTLRDHQMSSFENLQSFSIKNKIGFFSVVPQ